MNKAVFIDKDGTLIHNVHYNVNPATIVLQSGAAEALSLLQKEGYLLIVVSNQDGIARGYFTEKEVVRANCAVAEQLKAFHIILDGFYYCPHHPDGIIAEYAVSCTCRKPAPGMLLKAAAAHSVQLSDSWMIGDILDDVEAGRQAGCKTILMNNGNETIWHLTEKRTPHFVTQSWPGAAGIITGKNGNR